MSGLFLLLMQTFLIEKEEYTPDKFVKKFSDKLPLHVRVSKGYYGSSESTSVSEGDTFNIHFIKNTKVRMLGVFQLVGGVTINDGL